MPDPTRHKSEAGLAAKRLKVAAEQAFYVAIGEEAQVGSD